jgi:hypothetical protein
MKAQDLVPDLRAAIHAHLDALGQGDFGRARTFVAASALDVHRKFEDDLAKLAKPVEMEALALAKIGFQYVSKLRFLSRAAKLIVLSRWRKDADHWKIAALEDLSHKRSPWSDVPDLAKAVAEKRAENGIA